MASMSSGRLDANRDYAGAAGRGGGGGGGGGGGSGAAGLLSPMAYDDDASSLHSRSDQDSDSDDDQLQLRARNSRELRAADRIVLMEEEELDRLVTTTRQQQQRRGSGLSVPNPLKMFGRRPGSSQGSSPNASAEKLVSPARRNKRSSRRKQKQRRLLDNARHGEDGELMYEMEEGGVKDGDSPGGSSELDDSEEDDRRRLNMAARVASRGVGWRRWIFIHALIAIGFAMLVLISLKLSRNRRSAHPRPAPAAGQHGLVSNGTTLFAPTTIILSLDGFRADFLHRGLTPRLSALIREGISPPYMTPSFPSLTFPNHYTLATGLYPEAHGIVGNSFWDPDLQAEFYYTDPARSLDPRWWAAGEPFWVSAEKQGIRAAVHMWPGSEAQIQGMFASIVDKFNEKEALDNKVSRILGLLDLPGPGQGPLVQTLQTSDKVETREDTTNTRPQLIAAYVPNVDSDGHKYGPNSTEINSTLQSVDNMLGMLLQGLQDRNLTHIVNVIVVSDHGMATTDTSRLLQLEDLVDTTKIAHMDGWPLYGLRPHRDEDIPVLYEQLKKKATNTTAGAQRVFDVYLRDEDMPQQYNFARNRRIAPLWLVPKTGWAIVQKHEVLVEEAQKTGEAYHPRGLHGYDHLDPLMRAIFIARGPAFDQQENGRMKPFQNINVYNILCDSLGITPAPNNGTLRLPLQAVGTHSPENQVPSPADPPLSTSTALSSPSPGSNVQVDVPQPPRPHLLSASPSHPLTVSTSTGTSTRTRTPNHDDVPPRPVKASDTPLFTTAPTPTLSPTPTTPIIQTTPIPPQREAGQNSPKKEDDGTGHDGDEATGGRDGGGSLAGKVKGWWEWFTHKVDRVWDAVTEESR
ncbi:hypothetical protein E4U44_002465 [Claviceps purpurea]|nr:hypothetical protein E4U44_002465 [Claviceps purpurea]